MIKIMPTLVGLMVAVGILRASGFLELIAKWNREIYGQNRFSGRAGSAYSGKDVLLIGGDRTFAGHFKEYGTDSYIGRITSISMSCTETIFYTMSVYYMTARVTKMRYTLTGALLATLAGVTASVVLAGMMT